MTEIKNDEAATPSDLLHAELLEFFANAFEEFLAPVEAQDDYSAKAFADYCSHVMCRIGIFRDH